MRRSRVTILVIASTGLFAACGSSSKTASTSATTPPAVTGGAAAGGQGSTPSTGSAAATEVTATLGTTPRTNAGGTTVGSEAAAGSDTTIGRGSDPNSPYCAAFTAYKEAELRLDQVFTEDTVDVTAARPVVDGVDQKMTALEDAAPKEIAADMAAIAKPRHEVLDLVIAKNFDITAVESDPAYTSLGEQFNSAEMSAAGDRVHEYNKATCGRDEEF